VGIGGGVIGAGPCRNPPPREKVCPDRGGSTGALRSPPIRPRLLKPRRGHTGHWLPELVSRKAGEGKTFGAREGGPAEHCILGDVPRGRSATGWVWVQFLERNGRQEAPVRWTRSGVAPTGGRNRFGPSGSKTSPRLRLSLESCYLDDSSIRVTCGLRGGGVSDHKGGE